MQSFQEVIEPALGCTTEFGHAFLAAQLTRGDAQRCCWLGSHVGVEGEMHARLHGELLDAFLRGDDGSATAPIVHNSRILSPPCTIARICTVR
jgi:hypothetical protein